MIERKHAVRLAARSARSAYPRAARDVASQAVAARALTMRVIRDARTVLAYAATAEELDPAPLVAALRARGARVAFPRVTGPGELALHWCADASELAPGYCGVLEPDAGAESADLAEIDVVLVPGTAFDAECGRLGMGGGFYDRLLPLLRDDATALGLAFDEQIVEKVPAEAHDVPLDGVVTPTRTIVPGAR
ncbi:MAG TPA: 5-formyltetrahydrofolate cyclo-ligase [Coriobacteriia bacterium]